MKTEGAKISISKFSFFRVLILHKNTTKIMFWVVLILKNVHFMEMFVPNPVNTVYIIAVQLVEQGINAERFRTGHIAIEIHVIMYKI